MKIWHRIKQLIIVLWKTARKAVSTALSHFDCTFKILIIISIIVFLFMYWQKDRYYYHETKDVIVVFDKQTANIYYAPYKDSDSWSIGSPFTESAFTVFSTEPRDPKTFTPEDMKSLIEEFRKTKSPETKK